MIMIIIMIMIITIIIMIIFMIIIVINLATKKGAPSQLLPCQLQTCPR